MYESRRKELFPNVTDEQWNDWKWQVKNRIETLEDLKKYTQLWIEPILPDSFSRDELRGWYKIHAFYVENEYGARFLFDTYGSKWLAFEQKL